jgi:hypothetical protein
VFDLETAVTKLKGQSTGTQQLDDLTGRNKQLNEQLDELIKDSTADRGRIEAMATRLEESQKAVQAAKLKLTNLLSDSQQRKLKGETKTTVGTGNGQTVLNRIYEQLFRLIDYDRCDVRPGTGTYEESVTTDQRGGVEEEQIYGSKRNLNTPVTLKDFIEMMIQLQGSEYLVKRLITIVTDYRDRFPVELSPEPAKIEPRRLSVDKDQWRVPKNSMPHRKQSSEKQMATTELVGDLTIKTLFKRLVHLITAKPLDT